MDFDAVEQNVHIRTPVYTQESIPRPPLTRTPSNLAFSTAASSLLERANMDSPARAIWQKHSTRDTSSRRRRNQIK